jgi:hypothetical protein
MQNALIPVQLHLAREKVIAVQVTVALEDHNIYQSEHYQHPLYILQIPFSCKLKVNSSV